MASAIATALLTNATTGTGPTVDFLTAKSNVSIIMIPSGTITGGTVTIEVSHNGTDWAELLAMHVALRPGNHAYDFSQVAYRFWRANIVQDITGGGSVSATLMEAG